MLMQNACNIDIRLVSHNKSINFMHLHFGTQRECYYNQESTNLLGLNGSQGKEYEFCTARKFIVLKVDGPLPSLAYSTDAMCFFTSDLKATNFLHSNKSQMSENHKRNGCMRIGQTIAFILK
jgi:hypothetical protein